MVSVCLFTEDRALCERWTAVALELGHQPLSLNGLEQLNRPATAPAVECYCLVDLAQSLACDPAGLAKKYPDIDFLAMVAVPAAEQGIELLSVGYKAYCNRQMSAMALSAALTAVQSGEIWAGRKVTDHLLQQALHRPQPQLDRSSGATPGQSSIELSKLTPREIEVTRRVADGLSNKAIAYHLGLTERTVKAHLNAIFRKTGATNRVQLALAVNQGGEGAPDSISA